MNHSEDARADVVVARSDWESFIFSLERLITLHRKALEALKDLRIRNEALRTELRSALALPTVKPRPERGSSTVREFIALRGCRFCGREIEMSARFCDNCGKAVAVLVCECGRELGQSDSFCDRCGERVAKS